MATKKDKKVLNVEELAAKIVQATSGDNKATVKQLGTKRAFFEALIAKDGRGGAIGKEGRTINATLTILRAAGANAGIRVQEIRILDTEKKTGTKTTEKTE
jgi:predicted RNA-binding protein YlqC (UPF0109 family)